MRKTLFVTVVVVVLATGLGVAVAQLGGDEQDLDVEVPPFSAPSLTRPPAPEDGGATPPELGADAPGRSESRPPASGPASETKPPEPGIPKPAPGGAIGSARSGTAPPESGDLAPFLPESRIVQPRPGMENLRKTGWERVEVLTDNRVRVHFVSGVEPCTVLDHADVGYRPSEIVITLFEGSDPAARETACIMIAQYKAVDVALSEPVNGRTIVDGAR